MRNQKIERLSRRKRFTVLHGVKKHGKEYMKRAAKAGREGASPEELGLY